MMPAEKDNQLKWDGSRRGHYEVYYFKLNDPRQALAFWFRYTILIPLAGVGDPVGELWGIYFNSNDPSRNRAWKRTFPIGEVTSSIDPFELVWATGFMPGYEDYDTMCASSSCSYGDGQPIPGFFIIGYANLVQATDGNVTGCHQCNSNDECASDEFCNTAGICQ